MMPFLSAVLDGVAPIASHIQTTSPADISATPFSPGKVFTFLFVTLGPMKVIGPFAEMTHGRDARFRRNLALHGPAVIPAYYAGPHQAIALADALFGVTNPGGKLPFTLARHVGQMPIHLGQKWGSGYRRTKEDIHKGYLDMPSTPLFAFGHGLSYTTFEYSQLKLASESVGVGGELRASLTITNTGRRRGVDVVQLYAADTATGLTLPAQQLIGFARVDLEPGTSTTINFDVPLSLLAYTGLAGELIMEPGPVEVSVGSSSNDIRSTAKATGTGKARTIKGEERAFFSEATVG